MNIMIKEILMMILNEFVVKVIEKKVLKFARKKQNIIKILFDI